jgi:hypothetical protein
VSQHKPQIDHYSRHPNGRWTSEIHEGLEAAVMITSIAVVLKLSDVYQRIVFPSE